MTWDKESRKENIRVNEFGPYQGCIQFKIFCDKFNTIVDG